MTEPNKQTNEPNLQEQKSPQSGLNRRQFISVGASAAAALVFPKSAQADTGTPKNAIKVVLDSTNFTPPSLTLPSDTSFFQPNVIASQPTGKDYCTLTSKLYVWPKPYSDVNDPTTFVRAFKQVKPVPPKPIVKPPTLAPAPTLCINPGDLLQLEVVNTLAANTVSPPSTGNVDSTYCPNPMGEMMNHPNCFDTINMHFHGLHVSPISIDSRNGEPISAGAKDVNQENIKVSSDDVLYELEPYHNHTYSPWLPAFHAPGTHWYHSHRHGSTAIQVAGGMVGAIIVNEPPGQEICREAPDVVMIIQEEPQSLAEKPGETTYISKLTAQEKLDRGIYERPGKGKPGKFLVNGASQPTLNLQKGEIQRWRLINANSTPRAFMGLELREGNSKTGAMQTIHRIAVDGITLYGKSMDDPSVKFGKGETPIPFALGNRVDFLVNLDPGTYTLWKRKDNINAPQASIDEPLAKIKVDDTTTFGNATEVAASFQNLLDHGIPETGKPSYLNPISTIDHKNKTPVLFQAAGGKNNTPFDRITTPGRGKFQISNTQYQPIGGEETAPQKLDKIPQSGLIDSMVADLGSTQEWIIANNSGAAHPFHIHINPFLVVETANISDITINNSTDTTEPDNTEQIYQKLQDANWTINSIAPEGNGIDPTIWRDTFTIAPNTAYKIRHRFDDYWGTYVLHCHVLIHEDQGMMWNVTVNDVDGKGANPSQQLLNPVEI